MKHSRILTALGFLCSASLVSGCVAGGSSSSSSLELEQRVPQQDSQLRQLQPAQAEMWNQVQALRQEVQSLKGQVYDLQQVGGARAVVERLNKHDAALRQVAGCYAYDDAGTKGEELTLRSNSGEINSRLEQMLNERLAMAGIEVMEARINYLAYAPEIAAVMLRRQQADAIISAREKIVEGAVSMVHMALERISDEQIVELDEERKAAMVSNLLVVLCADEAAQPVVNAGTLHH